MVFAGGFVGLALLALWLFVIVDVISTDSIVVRNLPKGAWLLIVIILPDVGSILWLILGRPQGPRVNRIVNTSRSPRSPAPRGIEDRDDWPSAARKLLNQPEPETVDPEIEKQRIRDAADERSRKLREWESELIRREKELHEREQQKKNDDI